MPSAGPDAGGAGAVDRRSSVTQDIVNFPSLLVLVALVLSPLLIAAEYPLYHPKLANSKNGAHHDFPLGALSATGRLSDGEREILIMDVGGNGPAEKGGLRAGDRIVSAGERRARPYSKSTETGVAGPQAELAVALALACKADPPVLVLEVRRENKLSTLRIALPGGVPGKGELLAGIADHLFATQQESGRWQPGVGGDADVYMSAFCALALLAADDRKYLPAIRSAIKFINQRSTSLIDPGNPRQGPKNWQAASTAILLAEYQLATGDGEFGAELETNCDLLASRVSPKGRMGHHFDIPYNGGGLVVINVQAHLAWALAQKCGYRIDEEAWDRSMEEVRASVDGKTGALGYSARATWSPDISARTGAMAAALMVADREPKLARQLAGALVAHHGRMRHAHAMSSIGLIYGFAGIRMGHPGGHAEVLRKWRPYVELSRNAAGSVAYFGGKRNIGGDEYLGLKPIGNSMVALMLASGQGKLHMHGGRKKNWFGK